MEKKSRGQNCFISGKKYQTSICEILNTLEDKDGVKYRAIEVEGAKAGADITLVSHSNIGLETKDEGAFEGGCVKMTYNNNNKRLEFPQEAGLHASILGDNIIYEGMNLPWYEGKKTIEDWKAVENVFNKDVYFPASDNAVSEYYRKSGVSYIQIEKKGLYHTSIDNLHLDVPYFNCPETQLRIRSTKHKRKDGICTDITAALQYNKRKLIKSPYSLDPDGVLPPTMKKSLLPVTVPLPVAAE